VLRPAFIVDRYETGFRSPGRNRDKAHRTSTKRVSYE
jgi:hypothetical protein